MATQKKSVGNSKAPHSVLPLIVDPLLYYAEQMDPAEGIFTKTTKNALDKIENDEEEISAIFFRAHPDNIKLIKSSHLHRPNIPLFLFYDDDLPFSKEELHRLAIEDVYHTKKDQNKILENIKSKKIIALPKSRFQPQKQIKTDLHKDYHPIKIESVLYSKKSLFDLFVKVDELKYVKILNAMDTITAERTQSYMDKGITHFYIPKQSYRAYLNYCDTFTYTMMNNKQVSLNFKTSVTLNNAQEIMQNIKESGLKEAFFEPLENFLIMLNQLLSQVDPTKEFMVQKFLSNILLFEKAVTTTTIASFLAKPLQISSSHAYHQLGYAALLQDISLIKMSANIQSENLDRMSETEKKIYFKHPELSARELEKFNLLDEATLQAISQHHERKNKKGFPQKTSPDRIHRLAEVIGICNEFVNLLYSEKKLSWNEIKEKMRTDVFPGFSVEITEIFSGTFFNSTKKTMLT